MTPPQGCFQRLDDRVPVRLETKDEYDFRAGLGQASCAAFEIFPCSPKWSIASASRGRSRQPRPATRL